jgi:DNA invertase Pin-like site-specific DNA recombinase
MNLIRQGLSSRLRRQTTPKQWRIISVAEFERELIRERTGEGRKRAMAAGIKFGRKRKLSDYQRAEATKRRAAGETLASIAKSYGVHLAAVVPIPRHPSAAWFVKKRPPL